MKERSQKPQKSRTVTSTQKDIEDMSWAIFENSSDGIFIANREGGLIRANANFYQQSGYLASQIDELTLINLFPDVDFLGAHEPENIHQKPFTFIAGEMRSKSGEMLGVSVGTGHLSDGSLLGIVKQAEDQPDSRQMVKILRIFVDQVPVAIYRINREGEIMEVNAEACRSLKYSRDELTQMTVFDIAPYFTREMWVEHRRKLATERMRVLENFHRRKNGEIFPVEITVNFYKISDVEYSYSFVQDITHRKQTEEALKQSEQRFRTLAEATFEGIAITRKGLIHDLNDQLAKMLGYERGELLNKPALNYLVMEQRGLVEEAVSSGSPEPYEYLALRKDGTQFPVEIRHRTAQIDGQQAHIHAVLDITERKQAETALRESEFFLRKSQQVANIGSYYFDANTGMWTSSLALDEIFGINNGYVKDIQGWVGLIHPEQKEGVLQYFSRHVLAEHNRFDKEYRIIRWSDKQIRWVRGLGELEFDQSGNMVKMIGTIQDITESKQAELTLRESEERLRMLTENMVDVISLIDRQANVVYVSPSIERLFGLSSSSFIGKSAIDWVHPDDIQRVVGTIALARETKKSSVRIEYRSRHSNGDYLWVESMVRLLFDQEGNSTETIFGTRDITERRRVEQLVSALNAAALAVQTAKAPGEIFAAAAEQLMKIGLSSAFFTMDEKRRNLIPIYISYQDEAVATAEKLTGLRLANIVIPIEPVDVFRQTVWEGQSNYLNNIIEATQQVLPRPVAILASLVVRHLGIKKSINAPLIVENDVIGLFSVQSDDLRPGDVPILTAFAHQIAAAWRQSQLFEQSQHELAARKEAEAQVKRLNEELEERVVERTAQLETAVKELEAFSYSVSHDLRSPLRAINGYTQILLDDYQTALDIEGKRICGVVLGETQRMSQLIDDLLAFSRAGRTEMLSVFFDMRELAQAVYRELTKSENTSRIKITIKDLPPVVGDPKLIYQVWMNLLSNALKFTSKRERAVIEIGSHPAKDETIYYVRDNGAGFESAYASKLFGVFERLHVDSDFPGTGVGLAIVQRIINRHGGRVWAEGQTDQGATFFFAMPKKSIE